MDVIANAKEYANENDNAKIDGQETKAHGAPSVMISEEDGLVHNKVLLYKDKVICTAGGNGGDPEKHFRETEAKNETVAASKSKNRRKAK
jgi:hypothetical protein